MKISRPASLAITVLGTWTSTYPEDAHAKHTFSSDNGTMNARIPIANFRQKLLAKAHPGTGHSPYRANTFLDAKSIKWKPTAMLCTRNRHMRHNSRRRPIQLSKKRETKTRHNNTRSQMEYTRCQIER